MLQNQPPPLPWTSILVILRVRVTSSNFVSNAANLQVIDFPHHFHLFFHLYRTLATGFILEIGFKLFGSNCTSLSFIKNTKKCKHLFQSVLIFYSFNGNDQFRPKSPLRTLDFFEMTFFLNFLKFRCIPSIFVKLYFSTIVNTREISFSS